MKTKFQARYLESYIVEIFGRQDVKDPLLLKNLSQRTKFKLKKLGNSLQEEYKAVREHLQQLFEKYAIEEEIGQPELPFEPTEALQEASKKQKSTQKRIPEDKKEEFLKEAAELEDMLVEIEHQPFEEKDFIDKDTNEIVAGQIYYNLVDILAQWEDPLEEKLKEEVAVV